jgi:heptosyltransferase-1
MTTLDRPQRLLIVKTSSLGDVVHMLPALTDAARRYPGLQADWVVEESFAAVPAWHPNVARVHRVAIRRWRRAWSSAETRQEWRVFRSGLRATAYDAVVDAQGLLKSALITRQARGPKWGYDWASAREPLAAFAWSHRVQVAKDLHAIERNRLLLAATLGYTLDGLGLDYGLQATRFEPPPELELSAGYVLGLHGTSRPEKEWPFDAWIEIARRLAQTGRSLLLPWGNEREHQRAQRVAQEASGVRVLPRLGLDPLAAIIARADAVIGMDTGLMHIAAALGRGGVALFPVTAPALTGLRPPEGAPPIVHLSGTQAMDVDLAWSALEQSLDR